MPFRFSVFDLKLAIIKLIATSHSFSSLFGLNEFLIMNYNLFSNASLVSLDMASERVVLLKYPIINNLQFFTVKNNIFRCEASIDSRAHRRITHTIVIFRCRALVPEAHLG